MTYTDAQLDAIDRLVATEVLGWQEGDLIAGRPCVHELWLDEHGTYKRWISGWHPTRERDQAMRVFEVCLWMQLAHDRKYIYIAGEWDGDWGCYTAETIATADTPMLAICLAALNKANVPDSAWKGETCQSSS